MSSSNIVGLGRAAWNLFRAYPVLCITMIVAFVIACIIMYFVIKDIIWTDKGGPIILR